MYLNVDRARGLMKDFGIDAIVASTPENVTYVAGTVSWSLKVYAYSVHMFAVFPQDPNRPPSLVVPGQEVTYVSMQQSWIKDLYTFGDRSALIQPPGSKPQTPEEETYLGMYNNDARRSKNAGAALGLALRERGLDKGTIALDEERVMPGVRKQIQDALPNATIVNGADLFRLIRMVKTPDELKAMRAAAEVNELACIAASKAVVPGMTENEVASVFRAEVGRLGGMWQWFHFCSGRRATGIFPPTDKKLAKGEMWKFDAGVVKGNYQGDTGWGGVVGEPTKEQASLWKATVQGFDAAMAEVKAGVLGSRIYRTMLEATRAALPGHNGNFAGHAIGLEQREVPYILADPTPINSKFLPTSSDFPLEEGTTLCLENPTQVFGFGGTQIEKTVVVTRNGWEPIYPQERKLWVSPA
ncbi:MAG: aminopeptidase P family protein [Candidatus Tectomicrobia bacterium]|uniref:Aminopeptidase P family protein n=1 Tax=Tectimicrobiota bacterium TaxID=2528274 RepID=A0A932HVL1_UNCTE|nr:aminopeptidase P family protein [Candidatus Tectomicrobia bacterium]